MAKAGSGAGTVTSSPAGIACGSACNEGFAPGATVTLTATPAAGSRFAGWAGACGGAAPVCSVTMDGAKTVMATFTDAVAPNTRITAKPKKTTTARKATFRFAATEQPATFQCKLDKGAWKACTSPRTYAKLEPGKHTFRVRAKDASGNVDASPAVYAWTIRR